MALGAYYDVYTSSKYQERVNEVQQALASANIASFKEQGKDKLIQLRDQLKKVEKVLFKKFGVENIDALNKRMEDYAKALINFTGLGALQTFVEPYETMTDIELQELVTKATPILEALWNKACEQNIKENQETIAKAMVSALNLNQQHFSSTKGYVIDNKKITLLPKELTDAQLNRWRSIIQSPNSFLKAQGLKVEKIKSKQNQTLATYSVWFENTKDSITGAPLKASEAKERVFTDNRRKDSLNNRNRNIREYILNNGLNNQDYRPYLAAILEHMEHENPYLYFVGRNANDITGILGEAAAIFYVGLFVAGATDPRTLLNAGLRYRGSVVADGSKPHQDAVLYDIFGIQAKNTTDEISKINFRTMTLPNLMDLLAKDLEDFPEVKDLITNWYGLMSFNVPFERNQDTGQYTQIELDALPHTSNANEYYISKGLLDGQESKIYDLLKVFAHIFMYITNVTEFGWGRTDTNILFSLSTTTFCVASQIIDKIINDNFQNGSFSIDFSSAREGEHNIVNALNDNTRDPNYSKVTLDKIIISSSFDFSSFMPK